MTEPKLCPFCKGKVYIINHPIFGYQIRCTDNDCIMSKVSFNCFNFKDELVEAWNRRS